MFASVRQREHRQRTTELGELRQFAVAAHGAQAILVFLETRGHADAGPAAYARKHANVLLALMGIREHVANDAGMRLELEQLLVDVLLLVERAFQSCAPGDPWSLGP